MLAKKELEDIRDILKIRLNDIAGGLEYVTEQGGPQEIQMEGVQLKERCSVLISSINRELKT